MGYSSYNVEIYSSPLTQTTSDVLPLGSVLAADIETKAKAILPTDNAFGAFEYVHGSAGTGLTDRENLDAFKRWKIRPRMLNPDSNKRDLRTTLFGKEYETPLLLAPIGVQGILHADGELGSARAAGKMGIPFIMSSASSRTIEATAEAVGPNSSKWYQLYWPKTDEITISVLQRVKAAGFTVLVVTLDTFQLGWRPADLETSYLPFMHGVGVQAFTSDPAFCEKYNLPIVKDTDPHSPFPYNPIDSNKKLAAKDPQASLNFARGKAWVQDVASGVYRSWDDLAFLRKHWDGPILVKGIQTVEDAELAVNKYHNVIDGIIVSNHGGRQIDGAIGSLDALDEICQSSAVKQAQDSGKLTVLFDSGIRTGSDILKAIALGAQGVLLGRPYVYGLAVAGEKGVHQVIKQILADLETNMALSGNGEISQLYRQRDEFMRKLSS